MNAYFCLNRFLIGIFFPPFLFVEGGGLGTMQWKSVGHLNANIMKLGIHLVRASTVTYVLSDSASSILKCLILMQASLLCLNAIVLEENLLVKKTLIRGSLCRQER